MLCNQYMVVDRAPCQGQYGQLISFVTLNLTESLNNVLYSNPQADLRFGAISGLSFEWPSQLHGYGDSRSSHR